MAGAGLIDADPDGCRGDRCDYAAHHLRGTHLRHYCRHCRRASGWADYHLDLFTTKVAARRYFIEGATQNIATITMIILLMGVYGVLKEYGLLDQLVAKLDNLVGNSPRSTELTMFGFTWF